MNKHQKDIIKLAKLDMEEDIKFGLPLERSFSVYKRYARDLMRWTISICGEYKTALDLAKSRYKRRG